MFSVWYEAGEVRSLFSLLHSLQVEQLADQLASQKASLQRHEAASMGLDGASGLEMAVYRSNASQRASTRRMQFAQVPVGSGDAATADGSASPVRPRSGNYAANSSMQRLVRSNSTRSRNNSSNASSRAISVSVDATAPEVPSAPSDGGSLVQNPMLR
jgi:hypothetical protein